LLAPASADIENSSSQDLIARANTVLDSSLASTSRSKAYVTDAIKVIFPFVVPFHCTLNFDTSIRSSSLSQIGSATATTLHLQTEQLVSISGKVDQVESNLKRADKQIRAFIRLVWFLVIGILNLHHLIRRLVVFTLSHNPSF
jgi:SNARE protein